MYKLVEFIAFSAVLWISVLALYKILKIMCETWGRIRIRIWFGKKKESEFQTGIKTMPIHSNAFLTRDVRILINNCNSLIPRPQ
jgi:hypothetical protein